MSGIMSTTTVVLTFLLSFLVSHVNSLASTDTITWGGDNSRTGYQINHNMDPSIVGSSQFGQLFKTVLPGAYGGVPEQLFSQPLVYTPSDGIQYVYVATTQNNLYKVNAKTGAIVLSRNLHIPFLTADLDGCVDINPHVGVTATGVIDPATDTLYLTSKTYLDQTQVNVAQGRPAGRYYFHAIDVNDLSERAGFPKDLEGTVARNNPIRSFGGGIHHQRPALLHSGQYIYAGFASHCVQYNFTGWIMGWDKTTGAVVERYATEGAGVDAQTKGAGVWMSGGGLASDDAGSMFFATGNGYASQLSTIPVNGRNPPTSLEEAAVHMTINADGSLTIVDFFMPWEKTQLDGADKDLGTSPLELLPTEFSCGDVKRIGVVTGKSGKTYWLNLDDLGGYQNGPNKLDDVIQVYQNENSVYAGAGVYPLEGGYIYISVIGYPTHVFKFSCSAGVPSFAKVADTPSANAGILGVGHGTTTSLNGQAGTGLLWTSDVRGQSLRIYKAVPENGLLTQINGFNVDSVTKFTRPVFGDGRVYIGTTKGFLYGFGSPVNLPINCTSPVDFGTANLNTPTASKTITCKANVAVTISNVSFVGDSNFVVSGLPTVPSNLAAGATFTMSAVFNPKSVGILSADIVIATTNGVAGYSTSTPITMRGTGQSVDALLRISPVTLAFEGVIAGGQVGGVNQSAIFTNLGNADLSISDIQYSIVGETGPFIPPNGTAANPKAGPFTFYGLPSTIPGNSGVTVNINFDSSVTGNYGAYLKVVSNGGTKFFDVVGTAGSAPKALIEFQTTDGLGWVTFDPAKNFTFGNVTENQTRSLKMRVTNNGTSESTKLYLTVSKPPFGIPGIIGANNQVDLAEGTSLAPGESATAALYCSVPKTQWNQDPYYGAAHWTMNLDDPTFGKHDIGFDCTAVTEQAPPLLSNGLGLYKYTGCFKENNPGRQLKTQLTASDTMTNAICIAACNAAGVVFCGTQYNRECWGGPTIPTLEVDEGNCNYPCKGDINQICGGNGVGAGSGGSYISLFADSSRFDGNTTTPGSSTTAPSTPAPTGGPFVNPGVGGYSSIGCYTESTTGRALPNGKTITSKTVGLCVAACSASNYIYAGLEYGGECWCGSSFTAGSVPTAITACNMVCVGNATEYCGAGSRLNVYQKNSVSSSSSSSSRPVTVSSSSSAVSSGSITSSASTSSAVSSSSSVATSGSTSASTTGSSSLSSSATSSVGSSSTSATSSSTPSPTGPAIRQTVGKYNFQGCWTESTTGRALSSKNYADDAMTLESCATYCSAYSMFGVEYGRECYCGNSLGAGSVKATNQADCSFLCAGDKTTYCGAGLRLQLYSASASSSSSTASSTGSAISSSTSASVTVSSSGSATSASSVATSSSASSSVSVITSLPPVSTTTSTSPVATTSKTPSGPAIVPSVGLYNYAGCYTEGTNVRALSGALYANDSLTIQMCAQACSAYTYFGAEYGRECWCGNSFGAGSTLVSDKDCTKVCGGDSTQYCGNGNRLSVYIKNGTAGGTGSNGSSRPSSSSPANVATPSSSSAVQSTSSTERSSTSSAASVSSPPPTSSSSSVAPSSSSTSSSASTTSSKSATYTGPPVTSQGNVNFTYYSCVSEPSAGRLLPTQVENNATAMTISKCLSKCWNYQYAGVEYGQECWCGNSLNTAGNAGATPSANLTDSKCSFKCPGNSSEFCGAGGAMNLYWFDLEKAVRNAGGA
ncbi:WSC-domain-containing protein [Cadophora sp. DSE1049]|nr:WSC-domain-containing protein [Cadophora sp. DSE1049]